MAFSVMWIVQIPQNKAQMVLEVFDAAATARITNAQKIVQAARGHIWFKADGILDYENGFLDLHFAVSKYITEYVINRALELKKTEFTIDAEEILESGLKDVINKELAKVISDGLEH